MASIVHLLHNLPPHTRGGVEQHVLTLARGQLARGHRVAVAGAAPHGIDTGEGWEPIALGMETEWQRAQGLGRAAGAFAQWLEQRQPDLLHVHHLAATGPGPIQRAEELGIATVVTLHDLHAICPLYFRLRKERELCAPEVDADQCVPCLSEATGAPEGALRPLFGIRQSAHRGELLAARVRLAPSQALVEYLARVPLFHGLDVQCIGFPAGATPARRGRLRARAPGSPLRLATWGGLVRGKGLHLVIDAASRLQRGTVEVEHHGGWIDPNYQRECAELARKAGVALHFGGPYGPEELRARLSTADLAVFPSLFLETYGLTTDEAHGLGLPVVVSDRGAPKARLGQRGLVFRTGDAEDLARVLEPIALDPGALGALCAGEPPELVTSEQYLDRLERVYEAARSPR